jgi:hypothetical protein
MIRKNQAILLFLLIFAFVCGTLSMPVVAGADEYKSVAKGGEGRSVTDWPTGVTKYVKKKSYSGFTLWCSLAGNGTVNLMDMRGNIVHKWSNRFAPGLYAELLENGNLLYSGRTKIGYGSAKNHHMSGKGGILLEKTWDNKTVAKVKNKSAHHDQSKLPNGNYLQIVWEPVPDGRVRRVKGGVPGTGFHDGKIFEELITETDANNNRVWEWRPSDHLAMEDFPICPLEDRLEWLHINSVEYLPADNPITKTESIMVSMRHPSACVIFEKATGKLQWRYGGCIDGEWGRLGAQHDFKMIEKGLPGAGNIMIFDNGQHLPSGGENKKIAKNSNSYWGFAHSRVLEINPKTKKVVWMYEHKDKKWKFPIQKKFLFNAPYIAGAQRLPNGNTLICDGPSGRIFEVTKGKKIVWEFINPDQKAIFRAYRYGPDFAGFKGKNLPKPN